MRSCTRETTATIAGLLLTWACVAAPPASGQDASEGGDAKQAEKETADAVAKGVGAMYEKQKDVERGLSWRVALLPYLGYRNLYEQFRHDEPWDSPHNRKLIAKMPPVYESQAGLPEGKTTYVAL